MTPEQLRAYNVRMRQLRASPAALMKAVRDEAESKPAKSKEKVIDTKSKASQYL